MFQPFRHTPSLPLFSTASKHPSHSNSRNSLPFSSLLTCSVYSRGGSSKTQRQHAYLLVHRVALAHGILPVPHSSFRATDHGSRTTGRGCNTASRAPSSNFSPPPPAFDFQLSTFNPICCRLLQGVLYRPQLDYNPRNVYGRFYASRSSGSFLGWWEIGLAGPYRKRIGGNPPSLQSVEGRRRKNASCESRRSGERRRLRSRRRCREYQALAAFGAARGVAQTFLPLRLLLLSRRRSQSRLPMPLLHQAASATPRRLDICFGSVKI
jgi:hypothetical protein